MPANQHASANYRPDDFARSRRPVPSWLFSAVVHAAILLLLAFSMRSGSSGDGQPADRPVGIAIAHVMPDRTEYETDPKPEPTSDQPSDAAAESALSATQAAAASAAAQAQPLLDIDGLLSDALASPVPQSSPSSEGTMQAIAKPSANRGDLPGGNAYQHTTGVFGVSGTGNRFVYVFDRSESMNGFGGRPLFAAKREMIRSINSLTEEQEFQIVFYNSQARAFVPSGEVVQLLRGDQSTKRLADQYIRAVTAFGGTRHYDALVMALRMGPDVIFFMSDARVPQLNSTQLQDIKVRAQRSGTTIHAIELGTDFSAPMDSFLQTLAQQNGGQYRYLFVGDLTP